ncbi:MAG TPA: radical SAM protein [Pyrodictium sp.]|nr:radical SAM protein [Pyrodictium sp.]
MRRVELVDGFYAYTGRLPRGCELCFRGTKLVIFVTGRCSETCFYCPIAPERFSRDVIFADEEKVYKLDDILLEAESIGAEGASFTGGEPLLALHRVAELASVLKDVFGDDFHIHLYTSCRQLTRHTLRTLEAIGIDEVRFHPTDEKLLIHALKLAEFWSNEELEFSLGFELPVLPNRIDHLKRLLTTLDKIGVDFVNLNELEWAYHNLQRYVERGYIVDRTKPVVIGSFEAGVEIVKWAAQHTSYLNVHLCGAKFKDAIQMRNRMHRKALKTRYGFELVTREGLVEFIEAGIDNETMRLASAGYGIVYRGRYRGSPLLPPGSTCYKVVKAYPTRMRKPRVAEREYCEREDIEE